MHQCGQKINFNAPDASFTGEEEPQPENLKEPLAYFREFVTNEMIENIAQQTNLYSAQKEGRSINTSKLEMVKEYNKFMGGIGLHDMLTALYRFPL